jgi:molybdopterin-guanine dinucleotide biosynthesis protein A
VVFDAIILAGAHSARLDGNDKALVEVGGKTLLQRAVEAAAAAERVIVVGPRRDAPLQVTWVQERPAGGGPVAALAAGLDEVRSEHVCVLGVDHPLVSQADIASLVESVAGDGAIAIDAQGRAQPLVAVYRLEALFDTVAGLHTVQRARVHELIAELALAPVVLGDAAMDCDTWEDISATDVMMMRQRR